MTKQETRNLDKMVELWDAEINRHNESRKEVARLDAENAELKKQIAQFKTS